MMHTLDTTTIANTACKEAAPMLQNMAMRYECDFDELYQQAYLVVLECLQKSIPDNITNLKAWLHSTIRLSIIHSIYYTDRPESLDKPLNEDGNTTYGDLLAAPKEQQDTSELDRKIAALYAALRRLPLDEQRYAREVIGLNAYQPVIYDYSKREKDRTRSAVGQALYRHLRHDTQLASEVLS